jgi:hypothetical protein
MGFQLEIMNAMTAILNFPVVTRHSSFVIRHF